MHYFLYRFLRWNKLIEKFDINKSMNLHNVVFFTIAERLILFSYFCHSRLHLGFSAKVSIWQVSACKMELRIGLIFWRNQHIGCATDPPTHRKHRKIKEWVKESSNRLDAWSGDLEGVWKVSGRSLKGVQKVSRGCLEGV